MINNNISNYLTLTFPVVRALRGELHSFRGTWLRCNFLEWNGAPKRRPRNPAKRGSGSVGMPRQRSTSKGARIPLQGSHLPAEGTAPPCAVAFRVVAPCPAPQKPYTSPRPTTGIRLKHYAVFVYGNYGTWVGRSEQASEADAHSPEFLDSSLERRRGKAIHPPDNVQPGPHAVGMPHARFGHLPEKRATP